MEDNLEICKKETINYYIDNINKILRKCNESCEHCIDYSSKCTKCSSGYLLLENNLNKCFNIINSYGYYLD